MRYRTIIILIILCVVFAGCDKKNNDKNDIIVKNDNEIVEEKEYKEESKISEEDDSIKSEEIVQEKVEESKIEEKKEEQNVKVEKNQKNNNSNNSESIKKEEKKEEPKEDNLEERQVLPNDEKEEVICYPSVISASIPTVYKDENTVINYSFSNYYSSSSGPCDKYDNRISFNIAGSCSSKTTITNGSNNSLTLNTNCLDSFHVYVKDAIDRDIGELHIFPVCRPVTGVVLKKIEYRGKPNSYYGDSKNFYITEADFEYVGSENCTNYIGPNFEVIVDDNSVVECESYSIGMWRCRGKNEGQTTARIRGWNSSGSATSTSFNIIIQNN